MSEISKKEQKKEPEISGSVDANSWEEDQKKHDYYYDDSHGYETYVPDRDDDPEVDKAVKRTD